MADKKLIELTREDFQAAVQNAELVKQWAAEMAMSGEAPVCIITVTSEGKKNLRVSPYFSTRLNKIAAILKHLGEQLKFIKPVQSAAIRPN